MSLRTLTTEVEIDIDDILMSASKTDMEMILEQILDELPRENIRKVFRKLKMQEPLTGDVSVPKFEYNKSVEKLANSYISMSQTDIETIKTIASKY
jgi:hypothetical protein